MNRRAGGRFAAVGAGLVVALVWALTPASTTTARLFEVGAAWSPHELAGNYSADTLRGIRRFQLHSEAAPSSARVHVVMGSSEFSSPVSQNPVVWMRWKSSDLFLFATGRGYVQSLSHAIELAAIADDLRTPKVSLILSPQWFTEEGVGTEAFTEVFSHAHWLQMLDNDRLTPQTRQRIADRVVELGGPRPPLGAAVHDVVGTRMAAFKEELLAAKGLRGMSDTTDPQAGPVATIDWVAERRKAAEQGAAQTHNSFYVADEYFEKYVTKRLAEFNGTMRDKSFLTSPEYADLELFLDVAKELRIEVMLVSVPMNGWWYDHLGYDRAGRAAYYAKIRAVAERRQVRLADFSGEEYTPYFLYDIMHLGWKGWLDVTKALVDFELGA